MAGKEIAFPAAPHAHFGGRIIKTFYMPYENENQSPGPLRYPVEIKELEKMLEMWESGLTRLAAVTSGSPAVPPAWWDATGPAFTDLHTSNIGKVSANNLTGLNLFKELAAFLGKAKHQYAGSGKLFWAMNPKTALTLKIAAMEFNSAAAIVSGVNATMPVIGGEIVELSADILPDNTIVGGYGDQYLLADRSDVSIRVSDQVKFLADQTVYAGVARYDGKPKAGEGFVGFGLTTTSIATTTTFPTAQAG